MLNLMLVVRCVLLLTSPSHTHSLPLIVSIFDGPSRLYDAVEKEVCRWKILGPAYFCPSNAENLETELATLQEQR